MVMIALGACGLVSCASDPGRPTGRAAYHQELKTLRPQGSGETGYGLANCTPGACLEAQRGYHAAIRTIQDRYGFPYDTYTGALFAHAEAMAEQVDRGEVSPAQADAFIQDVRVRLNAERQRLDSLERQERATQQRRTQPPRRPLRCETLRVGMMWETTCH
jgi:hypothetical protein